MDALTYWVRTSATRHGHATHAEIRHDRANQISERIPRRLGHRHVETVTRDRDAPGESGTAFHWRMAVEDYPGSVAARLVAAETGRPEQRSASAPP